MGSSSQIVVKAPNDCSATEVRDFIALIAEGGEVEIGGLEQRVRDAARLAFLYSNGQVIGIAALKNPNDGYRQHVAYSSKVSLSKISVPYELGWVFVIREARGSGHAQCLSQAVVAYAEGHGVFATSRTDNAPMHHVLAKLGFVQMGEAYPSQHGKHHLQLFTRMPPNNSIQRTPTRYAGRRR